MPSQKIKIFLGLVFFIHSVAWSAEGQDVEKMKDVQMRLTCEKSHPMIQALCKREAEMLKLEDAINTLQLGQYGVILVTFGSLPFMILQRIAKKSAGTLVKNVNEVLSSNQVAEGEKKALQNLVAKNFDKAKKQNNMNNLVAGGSAVSFLLMGHYKNALKEEFHRQKALREIEIRNLELEILKSIKDGSLPEKFGPHQDNKSGKSPGATPETSTQPEDYI